MSLSATDAAIDDRGPLARPDADERLAVVRAAIRLFRSHAFHAVTLGMVAAEADLPIDTVLSHFAATDALAVETVQVWHTLRMAPIEPIAEQDGAVAFLRAIVIANIEDPALMRLLLAMTNIAATPGDPNAPILQRAWVHFHATVQRALTHDIAVGREPDTMDPACGAEQLIALFEGLQVQLTMRPHMDLLGAYDRSVSRLREGWSTPYQPLWQI